MATPALGKAFPQQPAGVGLVEQADEVLAEVKRSHFMPF